MLIVLGVRFELPRAGSALRKNDGHRKGVALEADACICFSNIFGICFLGGGNKSLEKRCRF